MRSATIQGAAGLAVKGESMAGDIRGAAIKSAAGSAVKVESRAVGMRGATIERARGAAGLAVEVKTMLGIDARASTEYRSGLQNGNVVQKGNEVADGSASRNLSKKSTATLRQNFQISKGNNDIYICKLKKHWDLIIDVVWISEASGTFRRIRFTTRILRFRLKEVSKAFS